MIPPDLETLVTADVSLTNHLWLGIGGPARYFAVTSDTTEVSSVAKWAADESLALRILGAGSNLLVRESGVDGVVVTLPSESTIGGGSDAKDPPGTLTGDSSRFTVGGGAKLSTAVVDSVGQGLAGLEHLVGLPGTVAGGVVGNVSAGGRDIGSAVVEVTILDTDLQIKTLTRDDIRFSHRNSSLGDRPVLSITFELETTDPIALTKRMQKIWIGRGQGKLDSGQRVVMPFADPDGMSTCDLLRSVGLAGLREGAVMMDDVRPDLLNAQDGATSDDCLRLIDRVREQVRTQMGVDLQLNLQIW